MNDTQIPNLNDIKRGEEQVGMTIDWTYHNRTTQFTITKLTKHLIIGTDTDGNNIELNR